MLMLEPVPALTAMLFALKMAKLADDRLGAQVAALDERRKQIKSGDSQGWAGVYREALALIPQVVESQQRSERDKQQAAGQQAMKQRLSSLGPTVSQKLQRAHTDWSTRLQEQVQELRGKAERAVNKLEVGAQDDPVRGETVYRIEDAQLQGFWAWLIGAENAWRGNNGQLVAVRANELIGDLLHDFPVGMRFEVRPIDLPAPPSTMPTLKGYRVPTPNRFEALGSTYKTVMGAVMGVSSVGFLATRLGGNGAAQVLPAMFGVVFLLAIVYAVLTVPKQHRQAMARQKDKATEVVRAELLAVVKERLDTDAAGQQNALKKHLTQTEEQRWSRKIHEATGGSNPGLGNLGGLSPIGGLSAPDLARLQGEWRDAIAERLKQLGG